jgi:WhiB family redox-sensing transcriptional regulator
MTATIRSNPRNTWLSTDTHEQKVAARRARHIERAAAGEKRMCARDLHDMYEGEIFFTADAHVRCRQCMADVRKQAIEPIRHNSKSYKRSVGTLTPPEFHSLWKTNADDWHSQGYCQDEPELFFPVDGEMGRVAYRRVQAAKAVCEDCPVKAKCLEYALDAREEFGVWGGTTPRDRDAILAQRELAAA